jgi:hypothetical protein
MREAHVFHSTPVDPWIAGTSPAMTMLVFSPPMALHWGRELFPSCHTTSLMAFTIFPEQVLELYVLPSVAMKQICHHFFMCRVRLGDATEVAINEK